MLEGSEVLSGRATEHRDLDNSADSGQDQGAAALSESVGSPLSGWAPSIWGMKMEEDTVEGLDI